MIVQPARESRDLVAELASLARDRFAARADHYDRNTQFPAEDFADLFRAGLLTPAVPREHGGLGLSPEDGLLTLWMMTREIARADLALARCWEGHVNAQILLAALGTPRQQARWFAGMVQRGEIWAAWSGEPQTRVPGQEAVGTTVREVPGGYRIDGTKMFATSAGGARWALLLVNLHGPGGARHAACAEGVLLLACDLADPTIRFDASSWDPLGMRATVSRRVTFNTTFVPAENLLGRPGQYLAEQWQTRFSPHYGAAFLGAAEAAFACALDHARAQGREQDPYVQHRLASMALNIETAHLWLRHVAALWESGRQREAQTAGNRARFLLEHWATETLTHAVHVCGARGLLRPGRLERIYRDLSFYVRHDNADNLLATIGRELLGLPYEGSFFGPPRTASCDSNGREHRHSDT